LTTARYNNNNSLKFVYLRAWLVPNKANCSQALKQEYRIRNYVTKFRNGVRYQ
jgi:hypothetical protein